MEQLNWLNVRNSVLWLLGLVCVLAYASFATIETAENYNNLSLVLPRDLVGYSLVAVLFAFLSLVLKGNINRLVNIIAGWVFAIGTLAAFIDGITVNVRGIYNWMLVAAVVLFAFIIWFAYRMPKKA